METLDEFSAQARRTLEALEGRLNLSTEPSYRLLSQIQFVKEAVTQAEQASEALAAGDVFKAMERYHRAGFYFGRGYSFMSEERVLIRGKKNVRATDGGTDMTRKLPSPEALEDQLAELQEKRPGLKSREYQKQIAAKYKATDSALRKKLKKK